MNVNFSYVILGNSEAAEAAIHDLDGTELFSRKVMIEPAKVLSEVEVGTDSDLKWGWWASDSNDHRHVNALGVRLELPKDIFRKRREGRTLATNNTAYGLNVPALYSLLHRYNVECLSRIVKYQKVKYHDPRSKTEEAATSKAFATRKEADAALHELDGSIWKGIKLPLRRWQVPRKYYGVTWSSGRPGDHFSGLRDQGSAVGTNLEYVRGHSPFEAMLICVSKAQEGLCAKTLLGKYDRKIWVTTWTYLLDGQ